MEQFFVYLIIFALLIFSSLNKKKKQQAEKAAGKANPNVSEDSNSFEEILKKIGGDVLKDLNIEEDEDYDYALEPTFSEEKAKILEKREKNVFENRTITIAERITARKANKINEQPKKNKIKYNEVEYVDYEFSSAEDLKKAVVYSEILSRKYF